MTEVIIHRPHNRARVVFLWVWAAITVAILIAAREILLPFILALVVAYVLAPAVGWVERWKIPRWGAVILVYVVTIGGLYASLAAIAPRLGVEMRGLLRELPEIAANIRDEHVPAMRHWLSNLTGVSPHPAAAWSAAHRSSERCILRDQPRARRRHPSAERRSLAARTGSLDRRSAFRARQVHVRRGVQDHHLRAAQHDGSDSPRPVDHHRRFAGDLRLFHDTDAGRLCDDHTRKDHRLLPLARLCRRPALVRYAGRPHRPRAVRRGARPTSD